MDELICSVIGMWRKIETLGSVVKKKWDQNQSALVTFYPQSKILWDNALASCKVFSLILV